MKTAAVIAEYNPFHKGHEKQFRLIKEKFGEDCRIVVLMSGCFVQRGEPALQARETRTKVCLEAGASLVLEIPLPYATAAAADFAEGAVRTLKAAGICRDLVCGAEDASDSESLNLLADFLSAESDAYTEKLRCFLDEGLNFPAARERAVLASFPGKEERLRPFFQKPNNILALEYALAVRRVNAQAAPGESRLKLSLLPREGDDRSSELRDSEQASATAIRKLLARETGKAARLLALEKQMPPYALAALLSEPLYIGGDFERVLLNVMLNRSDDELLAYRFSEAGLIGRLRAADEKLASGQGNASPWELAATKYYTETRFKRSLLSYALGIRRDAWEQIKKDGPAFVRVLGCDRHGRYLLRLMRKLCRLPRIDKASDLLENLNSDLPSAFLQQQLALRGDRLYRALLPDIAPVFDTYLQIR